MDWRERGISMVPELKAEIESALNAVDLWIRLSYECERACRSEDLVVAKKVFDFAWYCVRSDDADMSSITAVGFYEDIPLMPNVKRRIIEFLTEWQFDGYSELFKYHLDPIQHQRFLHEFRQAWKALPHNVRREREGAVPKERTKMAVHASDPVPEVED
jgi:hypothetical protein